MSKTKTPLTPIRPSGKETGNYFFLKKHLSKTKPKKLVSHIRRDVESILQDNEIFDFQVCKDGFSFYTRFEVDDKTLYQIAKAVSYNNENVITSVHAFAYPDNLEEWVSSHPRCKAAIKDELKENIRTYFPNSLRFDEDGFYFQVYGKGENQEFKKFVEAMSVRFQELSNKVKAEPILLEKMSNDDVDKFLSDESCFYWGPFYDRFPEIDYRFIQGD